MASNEGLHYHRVNVLNIFFHIFSWHLPLMLFYLSVPILPMKSFKLCLLQIPQSRSSHIFAGSRQTLKYYFLFMPDFSPTVMLFFFLDFGLLLFLFCFFICSFCLYSLRMSRK
jgi:hypothetical protein